MSLDDLIAAARKHSEGVVVPEEWGELIELEVGGHFVGRHRGRSDEGKSGAWLAWDETDAPRFIWGCYRLDQEYAREDPVLGADVVIYRNENYKTRYDDDGEASGLGYGVATKPNDVPLPTGDDGSPDKDDIPF